MAELERRIAQGRGDEPADIVLRGGRVFDLMTGELVDGDVAICGDTIVGIFDSYEGRQVIDVSGSILVPGFIDTHLHIECSCVTPFEFDRCVAPRGVTTAICDPHEIANVIGAEGIRYFQRASARTVMDIRVQLSSCVPSTPYGDGGRGPVGGGSGRAAGPSVGDRAGGVHELSRRDPPRPRGHGQAAGLRGRAYRRALPAAVGQGSERLYRRRHPHGT